MKRAFRTALVGIIAWAAIEAAPLAAGQTMAIGSLQVKAINLAEIDSSHVKVGVDLILVPAQSATLENLRLCSLRLNGLPVFAAPLNQEIVLRKGEAIALPPLYVATLLRDLNTVEPLREMIEKQNVRVQGELEAGLRLNFFEKLALHTQHPNVDLVLNEDVPVKMGSTQLERNVELSMLGVIESGLTARSNVEKLIPGSLRPVWIRDLEASARSNLFEVQSSYALTKDEASYSVSFSELGFRVSSARVVTTAEAWEPWKYDAEFLGAVKSNTVKLDKASQEIQLWPMGQSGSSLKLSAQDFAVEMHGDAEDSTAAVSLDHKKIKVQRRASPTSLAVLVLQTPPSPPGLSMAPATVIAQESWDHVAVFRLRVNQATNERSLDVIRLEARREGKGIRLSEPVDSAVFGSPIVTPDGVIGLVQDEQTGAFLPVNSEFAVHLP